MTRHSRLALAAAITAAGIVAVGVALRPLLPARHPAGPARVAGTAGPLAPDDTAATAVALTAAARALACPHNITGPAPAFPASRNAAAVPAGHPPGAGWCGPFAVTRSQTLCAGAGDRCQVQLVATLDTANGGTAGNEPRVVALTVTVARHDGAWHAIEVRS